VKGTDSEPRKLSLKHEEGVNDAFTHPKGTPLCFCRKAAASGVPGRSSRADTTEGQKLEAMHHWLDIGAKGRSQRLRTAERTEVAAWASTCGGILLGCVKAHL
jgi:hypothetical protein